MCICLGRGVYAWRLCIRAHRQCRKQTTRYTIQQLLRLRTRPYTRLYMTLYHTVQHGTARHGTIQSGMIWYGTVWHGRVYSEHICMHRACMHARRMLSLTVVVSHSLEIQRQSGTTHEDKRIQCHRWYAQLILWCKTCFERGSQCRLANPALTCALHSVTLTYITLHGTTLHDMT